MSLSENRLHINRAEVTATVVDGEAIMINLANGVYYSIDAAGARIWELAAEGANVAEIAGVLTADYKVSRQQAEDDIQRLLAQFVEEGLLVPNPNAVAPALPSAAPTQLHYVTPQLDIYREMGHLLALDPPMPGLENIKWEEAR